MTDGFGNRKTTLSVVVSRIAWTYDLDPFIFIRPLEERFSRSVFGIILHDDDPNICEKLAYSIDAISQGRNSILPIPQKTDNDETFR